MEVEQTSARETGEKSQGARWVKVVCPLVRMLQEGMLSMTRPISIFSRAESLVLLDFVGPWER